MSIHNDISSEDQNSSIEEKKRLTKMNIIYKAIEDGWSVKKSESNPNTFEFSKAVNNNFNGLLIFSKSNICDDIKNHLKNMEKLCEKHESKRSMSTPIIKNSNSLESLDKINKNKLD